MSENCATKSCGAVPVEDLTIADMRKAIEDRFAPVTHCEVDDLGTCGTSYKVIIVSVSNKSPSYHQMPARNIKCYRCAYVSRYDGGSW